MKSIHITFITTFILFSISTILTAQSNIPRLKQELAAPTADSCQLFYELGKEYEGVNIDSCFYFLQSSLTIGRRKNNATALAQAMCRIGYTYTVGTLEVTSDVGKGAMFSMAFV
jgi:hypothetical protein